jgi:sialidase-1
VRLRDGAILFTFTGWDSMAQRNVYARRSTDDGRTWSECEQISTPGWYCTNNDHVLRLKSGRIVLPAHGVLGGGPYRGGASKLESFMYLSDDEGRTWRRSTNGMTAVGRGCHEPTIVERRDGTLLCYLRTTNACIYQSTSADGGDHWTEPEPTELIAPDSPPLLKRIPTTGDLLLVWNRVASKKGTPRTPLTAAVSRDDGETWTNLRHLEHRADRDAAYASVYFHHDEALVCYYHREHTWSRDTEIRLRIIRRGRLLSNALIRFAQYSGSPDELSLARDANG